MLEIGRVVDPRRQYRHGRALDVARRQCGQHFVQLGRIVVNRQRRIGLEKLGEHALGDQTVLQHVGDPRGNAQVVFQHVHGAVGIAHQVRATDMRPHPERGVDPHALRPEVLRFGQHLGGKNPVPDDLLLVIQVVDEQVQRLHTLLQTGLNAVPLLLLDNARHDIERPVAIDHAVVFAVHRERDAHLLDREIRRVLARRQLTVVHLAEQADDLFRQWSGAVLSGHHLVEKWTRVVFFELYWHVVFSAGNQRQSLRPRPEFRRSRV